MLIMVKKTYTQNSENLQSQAFSTGLRVLCPLIPYIINEAEKHFPCFYSVIYRATIVHDSPYFLENLQLLN